MVKISKTKHITREGQVKKNPKKDETLLLKKMLYFEDLSTDYIDSQIKGIIVETRAVLDNKPYATYHQAYLDEKVRNAVSFLDGTIENFIRRMKIPAYREKFDKIKLPAYTKGTTKLLKKMMWFEYLNPDYIDSNIRGILVHTGLEQTKQWYDDNYLNEKRGYAVEALRSAMRNFANRMKNPELRAKWEAGER